MRFQNNNVAGERNGRNGKSSGNIPGVQREQVRCVQLLPRVLPPPHPQARQEYRLVLVVYLYPALDMEGNCK